MRKLLKLKKWLTVPDTARHLSILLDEEVSQADVLRLALDGHLTLSVLFVNHARGRCGPVVPLEEAAHDVVHLPNSDPLVLFNGTHLGRDQVLEHGDVVLPLEGVWDLSMVGSERLDVEREYQLLTDGPAVELVCLTGPIVSRAGELTCELMSHFGDSHLPRKLKAPWDHPDNFHSANTLPSGSVFVIRTSALQAFQDWIAEIDDQAKPIERRERTTLLIVIAALAKLAKVDFTKPSSAAAAIESETTLMGARVAARTIENHLNRIPAALESRED